MLGRRAHRDGVGLPSDATGAPAPVIELDQPHLIDAARKWLLGEAPIARSDRGATSRVINQCFFRFALSPEITLDVLTEPGGWNETKAEPPWEIDGDDGDETGNLDRLVHDLWNRRTKAPGYRAFIAAGETFEPVEMTAAMAPLAVASDDATAAPPLIASDGGEEPDEKPSFLSAGECLALVRDEAEPLPLVEGLLDRGAISAWYGPPNVGKSFILAALGFEVAIGGSFGGHDAAAGLAIYFAYEGRRPFRRRLAALMVRHGATDGVPLYLAKPPKRSIYHPSAKSHIKAEIAKIERATGKRVVLVVIDTLSAARAGGGRVENSADDMTDVAQIFREVAGETGAHVAIIHHSGKDISRGLRGGNALEGDVDSIFEITDGVITNTKQRDFEKGKDLTFKLEKVLVQTPTGPKECKVAVVAAGAGKRNAESRRRNEGDVIKDGILAAVSHLSERDGGSKVRVDDIREELKTNGLLDSQNGKLTSTARGKFARAKLALLGEGLKERDGMIWRVK
jgi:hypothetical protein